MQGSAPKTLRLSLVAELARFGTVGLLSNGLYFGGLWLLRTLSWPWWIAAAVAYAASMIANYSLQRTFTFRSDRPHVEATQRYLVTQLGALALNSALLELLLAQHWVDAWLGAWSSHTFDVMRLPALPLRVVVAQSFALTLNTLLSYVAQKHWVFRNSSLLGTASRARSR